MQKELGIRVINKGVATAMPVGWQAFVKQIPLENGLVIVPGSGDTGGFFISEKILNEYGYFLRKKSSRKSK